MSVDLNACAGGPCPGRAVGLQGAVRRGRLQRPHHRAGLGPAAQGKRVSKRAKLYPAVRVKKVQGTALWHQGQGRRQWEVLQSRGSLWPVEKPWWSRGMCPEGTAAHGEEPALEQSVRSQRGAGHECGGKRSKEELLGTDHGHHTFPLCHTV